MEHLSIKNFLCIEEAEFEVGRFNIIIGSQASGKSIIAKLLYFFREFFTDIYLQSIQNTRLEIEKEALNKFSEYFPSYTWESQSFEIKYSINNFEVVLTKNNFKISESLCLLYSRLEKEYKNITSIYGYQKEGFQEAFEDISKSFITELKIDIQRSIFIPAIRSFFPNVQKNIFSFLTNNIEIDPFLKKFGYYYEISKILYSKASLDNKKDVLNNRINSLIKNILKGKFIYELDQEWIETKSHRINLSSASSGQQEALPMLLILSVWAEKNKNSNFFIEEPEAHLFPISQKQIISLIGLLYNQLEHDFVLTTHSPYILTAINNAILAHDVIKEKGKEAVKDTFDPDFAIKYEDVKAYTIENGHLISIMDDEARLIGASVIDSVSDEFETVFDNLLDLQSE